MTVYYHKFFTDINKHNDIFSYRNFSMKTQTEWYLSKKNYHKFKMKNEKNHRKKKKYLYGKILFFKINMIYIINIINKIYKLNKIKTWINSLIKMMFIIAIPFCLAVLFKIFFWINKKLINLKFLRKYYKFLKNKVFKSRPTCVIYENCWKLEN